MGLLGLRCPSSSVSVAIMFWKAPTSVSFSGHLYCNSYEVSELPRLSQ